MLVKSIRIKKTSKNKSRGEYRRRGKDNPVCNTFCILHGSQSTVELGKPNSLKNIDATTNSIDYKEQVEKCICREKNEGEGLSVLQFRVYNCRAFERASIGRKKPVVLVENDSEKKTQLNRYLDFKSDVIKLPAEDLKATSTQYTNSQFCGR